MKKVLITGATGTIGNAIIPLFLKDPNVTEVILLIRSDSKEHLLHRVDKLIASWRENIQDNSLDFTKIRAISGDVTQDNLGIEKTIYDDIAVNMTHLIHCAANVKLDRPLAESIQISVGSINEIIKLIYKALDKGQFQKLDYVSTVGVAGCLEGIVPEELLCMPRDFKNTYEESKAEAEQQLSAALGKINFRATIHRPSMIVGDSKTGFVASYQIFYYLCELLSGHFLNGFMFDVGSFCLDTIPIDYVANAIYCSSQSDAHEFDGRILHLCSGPEFAISLKNMQKKARIIYTNHGINLPKLKVLSRTWTKFLLPFAIFCSSKNKRKRLEVIPYLLCYFSYDQTFANHETSKLLLKHSIELPNPENYIDVVIKAYVKKKYSI